MRESPHLPAGRADTEVDLSGPVGATLLQPTGESFQNPEQMRGHILGEKGGEGRWEGPSSLG